MTKTDASPILDVIRRLVEDPRVKRLPDHELLGRFSAEGDEAAFSALVRRHGPMVLDICRNMLGNEQDAEDAFQATFLVLARRASGIRKKSSVGSWLHGVAYRIALKGQAEFARRRKHEAHGRAQISESASDDLTWREVQQALHAELNALSERYRAPLVLCYLQGKTQDEVALLLGVSKATVKKRLEWARELLRARLMRRGLGPTAILITGAWPAAKASASTPVPLVISTVKAAISVAAGIAVASVVSADVAALTEGIMKAMFVTKLKIAAMLLLGAGIVLSAGMLARQPTLAQQSTPALTAEEDGVQLRDGRTSAQQAKGEKLVLSDEKNSAEAKTENGDSDRDQQFPWPFRLKLQKEPITVEGRVLSPDGMGLKGAEIAVIAWLDDMYTKKVPTQVFCTATSGERGEFRISVKPPQAHLCPGNGMSLLARHPDYAVGVKILDLVSRQQDGTIRLHAGRTVEGRVLDPGGRPVPDLRVALSGFGDYPNGASFSSSGRAPAAWPSSEPTDKNGRFKFTNIPRTQKRLEFDVDDARYAPNTFIINPAPDESKEITLQLSESRLVEGTVVCGDTGKPLSNAWLLVALCDRGGTGDLQMGAIQAKTNAEGKFQARCRPGKFLTIYVYPPFGTPYPSWVEESQPWPEGAVRKEVRISIRRGILVRGKVIDSDSGMGIADAGVEYTVPQIQKNNPYFDPDTILQIYWGAEYRRALTREDGSFELTVMPGPGALNVRAPTLDFVRLPLEKGEWFVQIEGQLKIDPKPETKSLSVTIPLRRGITIKGQLVGPKGENIESAHALYPHSARLNFWQVNPQPLLVRNGHFELPGCEPKKPTRVYFVDSAHGWGASADIDPQKADKEPPRIVLHPCGSVSVRFVDSQNRPWVGHGTWARNPKPLPFMYPLLMIEEPPEGERDITKYIGWNANTFDSARYEDLLTDADGRVTFPTLIPGAPYKLLVFDMPAGVVAKKDFTVEAGQNLKLPDITVERPKPRAR